MQTLRLMPMSSGTPRAKDMLDSCRWLGAVDGGELTSKQAATLPIVYPQRWG